MATKTQITVQIRPSHLQYEAYALNYAMHYRFDCVLVCNDQTYPLHRKVLSLATGLVKPESDVCSEAIVVHKRYWPTIEHLIELIYRGETTFADEVLPLFRRLNDEVNLKVSIGYHHWDMDPRLDKGPQHKAQLRKQDLPDSKGGQDAPINNLSIVDNARKERDLGCQGVVPRWAKTPVPLGSGSYEKLAHDQALSREMREMHYLGVFAKACIPKYCEKDPECSSGSNLNVDS